MLSLYFIVVGDIFLALLLLGMSCFMILACSFGSCFVSSSWFVMCFCFAILIFFLSLFLYCACFVMFSAVGFLIF